MIRIGLVDLDTSHPHAFTEILRTIPGVEVHALWDGHDVWPEGYDRAFARDHGIPIVCGRLEEMLGQVDAAMIHGTNWNTHLEKAELFMRAGLPVLIDKPVVGTVRDCDRLLELQQKYGSLVFGGSSLRYAREVTALRESVGSRATLLSVVASGPGDFFSYGIHTTEMLQGFLGAGIRSVRPVVKSGSPVLAVTLLDGFVALMQLQMPAQEWTLSAYTVKGLRNTIVRIEGLYEPFLWNFARLLNGEEVEYSLAGPVEAVRFHIAAKICLERGTEVSLNDLPPDAGFDGGAFTAEYAAAKRQTASPPGSEGSAR
jgi:hypothetical protein